MKVYVGIDSHTTNYTLATITKDAEKAFNINTYSPAYTNVIKYCKALVKQYGDYVDTSSVQKAISVKIDSSFNVDVECNEKLIDFNSEKIASDTQSFNQNADDVFISYSEISEDDSLKNWMSQQYKKIEYEDLIETNNIELKMSKKRGDIFSSYNKTMGQGGFLDKSELIRRLMNNMESELEKEILQDIGEKLQKDYGVALPALKNTKYKP